MGQCRFPIKFSLIGFYEFVRTVFWIFFALKYPNDRAETIRDKSFEIEH